MIKEEAIITVSAGADSVGAVELMTLINETSNMTATIEIKTSEYPEIFIKIAKLVEESESSGITHNFN